MTLTAFNELKYYRGRAERMLVIAPKRVAESTWAAEAAKWDHLSHLRVSLILGPRSEREAAAERDADVYVINRENTQWLVDNWRGRWKWDTVVLDELSSFKNPRAKRFRALRTVMPQVGRVYGLTGTPAANGLMDLWAQVYLLDRGERLGSTIGEYRTRFFTPDKRNGWVVYSYKPREGAADEINALISDICVSMSSRDWLELPPVMHNDVPVSIPPESMERYREMETEYATELAGGEVTAANAAAAMSKLLQLAAGFAYDSDGRPLWTHTAKLDALEETIQAAGGPVLVFHNFRAERDAALERLGGSFRTRALRSDSDVEAWNAGRVDVLLAHPASAAYGLNMQEGGRHIVWMSPTWNLELYSQANARLHRQGQTGPVVVSRLLAPGTADTAVAAALKRKDGAQKALLGALRESLAGKERPK